MEKGLQGCQHEDPSSNHPIPQLFHDRLDELLYYLNFTVSAIQHAYSVCISVCKESCASKSFEKLGIYQRLLLNCFVC